MASSAAPTGHVTPHALQAEAAALRVNPFTAVWPAGSHFKEDDIEVLREGPLLFSCSRLLTKELSIGRGAGRGLL